MLKLVDLAKDLVEVAVGVGLKRNDLSGLKKLVESLAAAEVRQSTEEQKGYARIFREYTATGFTRLFKLVDKHWPVIQEQPQEPQTAVEVGRRPVELSWTLFFKSNVDPILIAGIVNSKLAESRSVIRKIGSTQQTMIVELLIEETVDSGEVARRLREITGIVRISCRAARDFGMPQLEMPVLRSWDSNALSLDALHRYA